MLTAIQVASTSSPALVPARYAFLPALNAALNGTAGVLVAAGVVLIKRKQVVWHRRCMIAAVVASSLFLVSYLYYHYHVGTVRFQGQGMARPVYFGILISHTILAAAIVPLVILTLSRALRSRFERHRAVARWTYPLWLYVSATGVIVYLMLYRWFAPA